MFLGCERNEAAVKRMISCQPQNPKVFLLEHLRENIAQITRILGKNEEFTQLMIMKILNKLTKPNHPNGSGQEWAKVNVQKWETDFAKEFIRKVNEDQLDREMNDLRKLFKQDLDGAKSAILIIMEETGQSIFANSPWLAQFWFPRKVVNVDHLERYFRDLNSMKKALPSLVKIQKQAKWLHEVRSLPKILKFQKMMQVNFDGKLDVNFIDKMSVKEFMRDHHETMKDWEETVNDYLAILDRLKEHLFTVGIYGPLAKNALEKDGNIIDQDSNCSVLIPNKHRLGSLALAIIRFLAGIHNELITEAQETLNLNDLEEEHLIKYDHDDLNILLLANSKYELKASGKGQMTKWSLDQKGLETSIFERFLKNVPKLDEISGPRLFYTSELTKFAKLNDKIRQERLLPSSIAKSLESELKQAPIVGKIISKVEIAQKILAEVGQSDFHMDGSPYLTDCLSRLKIDIKEQIKGLKTVELKHIEALLKHLGLIKAKLLVFRREDPFMNRISHDFKKNLDEDKKKALDTLCNHMQPEIAIKCLYGTIIEKLITNDKEEPFNLNAPLRDVVYAYLEEMDEDEKAWDFFQHFDEKILVENSTTAFAYLANKN